MFQWFVNKATSTSLFIQSPCSDHVDSSSNIMINCYSDSSKNRALPCRYNWYRFNNGVYHNINNVRGNTYVCDAADIGSTIKVEICSLDSEITGTKVLQFGPIRVNIGIRRKLENILSKNIALICGKIIQSNIQRQCEVKVTPSSITIKDIMSDNCYKFQYSRQQPKLELNMRQPTKLIFKFGNMYHSDLKKFKQQTFEVRTMSSSLQLKFTRQNKDILYLAYKCFLDKNISFIHLIESLNGNTTTIASMQKYIKDLEMTNNKLIKQAQLFRLSSNKYNPYNSIVTVMTENNIQQKLQSLQYEKSKLTHKVKALQTDNLRLSQRSLLSNQNQTSADDEIKKLKQENKQISKKLQYYKRKYNQISKQQSLTSILDDVSQNSSTFRNSLINFQGNHISRIPLSFKSSRLSNQKSRSKNPLFQRKTQTMLSPLKTDIKINQLQISKRLILSLQFQITSLTQKINLLSSQNTSLKSKTTQLLSNLQKLSLSKKQCQLNLQQNTQILSNNHLQQIKLSVSSEYKKQIHQLQQQIKIMQSNQNILNKTRSMQNDYSMYKIEQKNILKQQNDMLMQQNDRLTKICEKYIKQAKQTTRLRGDIIRLNKQILEMKERSLIKI